MHCTNRKEPQKRNIKRRIKKIWTKATQLWQRILELLYPKRCCFCGTLCMQDVCSACAKKIVYVREPRCKKCGKPVRYEEQEYCYDCKRQHFYYEQGRSVWLHKDPVKWSVYQFKYHNRRVFGSFYAKEMYRLYSEKLRDWGIDLIVPVPLHWKRRWKRGYNQSEIVAKHLGNLAGIPVDTKAVIRKRDTKPQKALNSKERKRNLQDVFEVQRQWETPRNILLIDDIYTTGSTVDGVARAFYKKGPNKVWFFTISIGQDF